MFKPDKRMVGTPDQKIIRFGLHTIKILFMEDLRQLGNFIVPGFFKYIFAHKKAVVQKKIVGFDFGIEKGFLVAENLEVKSFEPVGIYAQGFSVFFQNISERCTEWYFGISDFLFRVETVEAVDLLVKTGNIIYKIVLDAIGKRAFTGKFLVQVNPAGTVFPKNNPGDEDPDKWVKPDHHNDQDNNRP